mmetsp:Transcript_72135/g.211357  ORF Transcript_72135/g.211357 Transcript_72135/m.211357 type:complete len:223 (-) Transcript_72135:447-1115(-)
MSVWDCAMHSVVKSICASSISMLSSTSLSSPAASGLSSSCSFARRARVASICETFHSLSCSSLCSLSFTSLSFRVRADSLCTRERRREASSSWRCSRFSSSTFLADCSASFVFLPSSLPCCRCSLCSSAPFRTSSLSRASQRRRQSRCCCSSHFMRLRTTSFWPFSLSISSCIRRICAACCSFSRSSRCASPCLRCRSTSWRFTSCNRPCKCALRFATSPSS